MDKNISHFFKNDICVCGKSKKVISKYCIKCGNNVHIIRCRLRNAKIKGDIELTKKFEIQLDELLKKYE